MVIYGTSLLALCLLSGVVLGELLGLAVGVDANVGGVGIAMLLLIVSSDYLRRTGRLDVQDERGITFWSAIYIPIVVAMAASQNVVAAIDGGLMAVVAGGLIVIISFAMVPVISRVGGSSERGNSACDVGEQQ